MRKRTKVTGLVSHTTPEGKSYSTSMNKCFMAISKMAKSLNRAHEVLGDKIRESSNSNYKVVMFCGKPMRLTAEEYDRWCMAYGQ